MDSRDEESENRTDEFVHSGKSEVEVTNNRRLQSTYCTKKANYR